MENINKTKETWEINPTTTQYDFLMCKSRYPAFVGGWGTGKTMFAILKCILLAKEFPAGLGLIARKEYTDLRDSTIADFERYTKTKIKEQHKEIVLPQYNNFKILFRHADEFNTLQNINLTFFFLEQADEIEDENIFDFLRGRLRRGTFQQGIITANATDTTHWIYRRFKEHRAEDYALFEMSTSENAKNLPETFLKDLYKLQKENAPMFDKYVANIWGVSDDRFILIPTEAIEELKNVHRISTSTKKIIAIDPSGGGDECPVFVFHNTRIVEKLSLYERDTMKIVANAMILGNKHNCKNFAVDVVGLGKGVADRLKELGNNVIALNSAEASQSPQYYNKRAEMFCYVAEQIKSKKVEGITDDETIKQLSNIKYKVVSSSGTVRIEDKADIRKRLGRSPDRADCYVYGIYALQYIQPEKSDDYDDYEVEVPYSVWSV